MPGTEVCMEIYTDHQKPQEDACVKLLGKLRHSKEAMYMDEQRKPHAGTG